MNTNLLGSFLPASFANFDQRARNGEHLSVVFFGGSLTWGANATDPQQTSYRALISQKLRAHYPHAHFHFWDAAIGGTGSRLGVFRLERDVLSHQPDLVFLDFTVNDNPYKVDEENLASYEAILRRLVEQGVCILPIILAVKSDVGAKSTPRPLDQKHQELARAYGCPSADVVSGMQRLVEEGHRSPDQWWLPGDDTHPVDMGYAAYAAIIWHSYSGAVHTGSQSQLPPQMLHASTYLSTARIRISSLEALPEGWRHDRPNRISAWYDALMSRWLDDVCVAEYLEDGGSPPSPLHITFRGSTVLLFGEATLRSGKYRALIDGIPCPLVNSDDGHAFNASASAYGGNMHHVRIIAQGLAPDVDHKLEIQPHLLPGQELRLESVCVAGANH